MSKTESSSNKTKTSIENIDATLGKLSQSQYNKPVAQNYLNMQYKNGNINEEQVRSLADKYGL